MRIVPINPAGNLIPKNQLSQKRENTLTYHTDTVSFGNKIVAEAIEKKFKDYYNIEAFFCNNNFVADSLEKTAKIFHQYFGKNSLPNNLSYIPFSLIESLRDECGSTMGAHLANTNKEENTILYNADFKCFDTKDKMKFNSITERLAWWHPTGHYLQVFVHEFGHSAHYKNLYKNGCPETMDVLRETQIPTAVGKLITKFKLGRYAATNMNEFMAERITKDICKNLDAQCNYIGSPVDLDYSNIFSRKWSYRYTSPQSYLDYYTQQIWNGDTVKAEAVVRDIENFLTVTEKCEERIVMLKPIETAQPTPPVLNNLKNKKEGKTLFSKFLDFIFCVSETTTKKLDDRNNIKIQKRM